MQRPISSALICGAVAVLAGCASSGGGPAPSPAPTPTPSPIPLVPPSTYETSEYNRMGGHAMIKASSVYATGADGSGQVVVVADSGVYAAHADLAGRVNSAAGWDYANAKAFDGTDATGHGTHVAGTIAGNKNDSGVHGVAYKATIVPFKITAADGSITVTDAMLADMAKRAASAGAIAMNSSWGNTTDVRSMTAVGAQFAQFTIEAVKAGKAGTVFVWAAMNEGGANPGMFAALPDQIPELKPYWLTVAAVDPATKQIASFSNRCGYAAAWCLSAPGVGIESTANGGGYVTMSGTSMATPYVTGSIALLGSYFKTLTGPQIAQRLLATADKSGAYADQSIYGQGMLNLEAAMQPVAGAYVPTGASTTGSVSEMQSAAITVPAGTAEQVKKALGDKKVLVVDGFQRATFYVKASSLVRERARANVDAFGQGNGLSVQPISKVTAPGMSFSLFSNRAVDSTMQGMSSQFSSDKATVRMGYGAHSSWGDMSFLSAEISPHFAQFVRGGDPLSMATQNFAGASYLVGQELKLTGQFASMTEGSKYDVGIEKAFGKTKLGMMSSFQSGLPEAMAFGASKAGASHSYQMYASHPVKDRISLVGAVGFGQSNASASMGEWRLDGGQSRSFASVGAVFTNLKTNSRLGVSYRMEQRSQQGMSLRLPVDTTASGSVIYQSVNLQDGQGGRSGALGLFYEGDADIFGNVVFGMTAAKEGSGAWMGVRRSF